MADPYECLLNLLFRLLLDKPYNLLGRFYVCLNSETVNRWLDIVRQESCGLDNHSYGACRMLPQEMIKFQEAILPMFGDL